MYSNLNILFLGFVSGYEAVGIFSIAHKIFEAIMKIIGLGNTVLFPHLSTIPKSHLKSIMQRILKYYLIVLIIIASMVFVSAKYIIFTLFGEYPQAVVLLKLLCIVLVFSPFGGLFTNYFILTNQHKLILRITFYTMVFNVCFMWLIYVYGAIGLGVLLILTQLFQAMLNYRYYAFV
ncbi:MAG: hypothetical protein GXO40_06415 [Epsilonproteobacteria bacterium]|nr:hypothetical protein [Campylobacterota bacterium]